MKTVFNLPSQTVRSFQLPVILVALCLFPVAASADSTIRDIPTDHSQFTYPAGYMNREPTTPESGLEDLYLPEDALNLNDPDAFEQKAEVRDFYHVLTPDILVVSADHETDKTADRSRPAIKHGKDKRPGILLRPIFN